MRSDRLSRTIGCERFISKFYSSVLLRRLKCLRWFVGSCKWRPTLLEDSGSQPLSFEAAKLAGSRLQRPPRGPSNRGHSDLRTEILSWKCYPGSHFSENTFRRLRPIPEETAKRFRKSIPRNDGQPSTYRSSRKIKGFG